MDPADRQAIYDLITDYCYTFDSGDHDAFAALFSEDAVFGRAGSEVQGREAIRELVRNRWLEEPTPRRHMVSNIRLQEPSEDGSVRGKAMFLVTIATTGVSRARASSPPAGTTMSTCAPPRAGSSPTASTTSTRGHRSSPRGCVSAE